MMSWKPLFFLFLFFSAHALAQVQFNAVPSKTTLGLNERLRVDFTMNQDGDNFVPPSFEGFTVVAGPNQSVSQAWINGKRSYSKTYSYYLAPERKGNFTIRQAEITIDGSVYKTTPIEITVTAAVNTPTDGDNSTYVASENLHLVAEISETEPYLNEAITVVYKLYVSPRINVTDWHQMENPAYRDFWSQNIDIRQLQVQNGTFQGEPYGYVVLRKTVLYPQKTGELNIEPLTLSISVEVPSNRRDIFGNRFYESVEKVVSAGNRTIDVKPLPQEGRPPGFTGAVGRNLQLEVDLSKTKLKATESLEATVSVRGSGNLKLFDLPPLQVPASMEIYEPEYSQDIETDLRGMHGSVSNTYTLVPQSKGKYPIPPVTFSYFDLGTGTYRTLNSEELLIEVEAAPAGVASETPSDTEKGTVLPEVEQFRYIKLEADLVDSDRKPFLTTPLFWSLYLGPLLLLPLAILLRRKKRQKDQDIRGNRMRKADKMARKYLSEARRNLGDQKKFYDSLERALHNYLKARLHIQTSEMSKERIEDLLLSKGVRPETVQSFIEVVRSCEFARYTPTSQVAMKQDYEKSVQVISEIDKQV